MAFQIAFHPGEDIREELAERGRKQNDFAEMIGVSKSELNNVIQGRRRVSAKLAWRIGEALGTSPEVWMGLQDMYDLYELSQNENEIQEICRIRKVKAKLEIA